MSYLYMGEMSHLNLVIKKVKGILKQNYVERFIIKNRLVYMPLLIIGLRFILDTQGKKKGINITINNTLLPIIVMMSYCFQAFGP